MANYPLQSEQRRIAASPNFVPIRFNLRCISSKSDVDLSYRAVAIRDQDDMVWFWIGTHSEYDRLLK